MKITAQRKAALETMSDGNRRCGWDFASSTTGWMKKHGYIALDGGGPANGGVYYVITDAGRAALTESKT